MSDKFDVMKSVVYPQVKTYSFRVFSHTLDIKSQGVGIEMTSDRSTQQIYENSIATHQLRSLVLIQMTQTCIMFLG